VIRDCPEKSVRPMKTLVDVAMITYLPMTIEWLLSFMGCGSNRSLALRRPKAGR